MDPPNRPVYQSGTRHLMHINWSSIRRKHPDICTYRAVARKIRKSRNRLGEIEELAGKIQKFIEDTESRMEYELGIKENALDSFLEALDKFEQGEAGDLRSYKFAILNFSHFLELTLKLYICSIDENLVYSKCFRHVESRAKKEGISLLDAYQILVREGFDFSSLLKAIPFPHTITLDQALEFAKCEKCSVTGVHFVDVDFSDDVEWIKGLRNNIEHYHFKLTPKEVRLCIGRLVRGVIEFLDAFSLFNLEHEVGAAKYHVFKVLADEYAQLLKEAERDVKESEAETFKGVRPKHYVFIDWNVYECPQCLNNTMIPNPESGTGYRCTFCSNEESEEIEVACDCCGIMAPSEEMASWPMDDGTVESRCYYCSGQNSADKDD